MHIARGRAVYALPLPAELDLDRGVTVTSISVDLYGPADRRAEDDDPAID